MLHVESLTPNLPMAPETVFLKASTDPQDVVSSHIKLIEMTFRGVEFDGRNLWREPEDVAIGQLAEAVRLADLRGRSEMTIKNITPWILVGDADSRQVPILQKKIQGYLDQACRKLKRSEPPCRLDLSHGEYGIRCYLGRTKPTDHIFAEDMVSDSR